MNNPESTRFLGQPRLMMEKPFFASVKRGIPWYDDDACGRYIKTLFVLFYVISDSHIGRYVHILIHYSAPYPAVSPYNNAFHQIGFADFRITVDADIRRNYREFDFAA